MDAERFDAMVRALRSTAARRAVLRTLVSTAIAGLIGRTEPVADARRRRRRKSRRRLRNRARIGARQGGVRAQAATCTLACDPVLSCCTGSCVDLQTDANNCGKCGKSCAAPANGASNCVDGACLIFCDPGFVDCGDVCVDTSADSDNCGSCGAKCRNGESCLSGICQTCAPGLTECGGVCADLTTDLNNCGKCGADCAAPTGGSAACVAGSCAIQCDPSLTDCDGACADLITDPSNCGGCGIECGNGQACIGGICDTCPTGLAECGGICVDVTSDSSNCGKCGAECGEGAVCEGGACVCGDFCGRVARCGADGACTSVAGTKNTCVCIAPTVPVYGCANDADCGVDGVCIDYLSTQRGCVQQELEGGYCRPFCAVGPPDAACPATTCQETIFCNGTEATRECVVLQTADGFCACLGPFDTADPAPCTSDAECGPGYACQDGNAFWQPCSTACMPRCLTP